MLFVKLAASLDGNLDNSPILDKYRKSAQILLKCALSKFLLFSCFF